MSSPTTGLVEPHVPFSITPSKQLNSEHGGPANEQHVSSNHLTEKAQCHTPATITNLGQDEPSIQVPGGGDLIRSLHFYSPPLNGAKPSFTVTEPNGVGSKNYQCTSHPVLIRDMRAHPTWKPSLSLESFQLLQDLPPPPDVDITNDEQVKAVYSDAAKALIRAHIPGVQDVVVFDQTVRRASADVKLNRPVKKVHVDQSFNAGFLRAQAHLPKEQADAVLAGKLRLRIINVWRPLRGPITDHPLCLAESQSVPDCDLVEIDHIYHDRKGETYHCRYRGVADHRFWYLSSMEISDAWMIQCFDSVLDSQGRRRRCVHASFEMIELDDGCCDGNVICREGKSRESVEVRCLVLGGDLEDVDKGQGA